MCVGDIIGGIFGMSAARSQANATRDAANSAAEATRYATDQQINYLTQGANQGAAQLQPMVDDATTPNRFVRGALGVGTAQDQTDYNAAYDTTYYKTEADYNTAKAHQALISTNAAMGKGGAINSGKALRAAGEQGYELAMQGRETHLQGLKGYVDRGDAARSNIANIRIGQGGQIANAFGNQGAALAAIAQQRGQGLSDAAASGGLAIQNALGGISGQIANGGFQGAQKTIGNAFGFRPSGSVTSSKGGGTKIQMPRKF